MKREKGESLRLAYALALVALPLAVVFLVALGTAAAVVLTTRPVLVLVRTRGFSSTTASAVFLGLLALALGLAAAFLGAAAFLVVDFGAALVAAALVFFGAAAFLVVVLAFFTMSVVSEKQQVATHTVAVAFLVAGSFLVAAFFSVAFSLLDSVFLGALLDSFFASFTGPEGPATLLELHTEVHMLRAFAHGDNTACEA